MQQISLQHLARFTKYSNLNLKVQFAKWTDVKNNRKLTRSKSCGLSPLWHNAGTLSDTRSNRPTLPKWRLLEMMPPAFIDETVVLFCSRSFRNRLRPCVAAAAAHFEHYLNSEWAVDIRHWNVWTVEEKLCKISFVIREYSVHNCMFTRKSELLSLNCCICWTMLVILMKTAGYMLSILTYKVRQFESNSYYRCWNTKVFHGEVFLLAHLVD